MHEGCLIVAYGEKYKILLLILKDEIHRVVGEDECAVAVVITNM